MAQIIVEVTPACSVRLTVTGNDGHSAQCVMPSSQWLALQQAIDACLEAPNFEGASFTLKTA